LPHPAVASGEATTPSRKKPKLGEKISEEYIYDNGFSIVLLFIEKGAQDMGGECMNQGFSKSRHIYWQAPARDGGGMGGGGGRGMGGGGGRGMGGSGGRGMGSSGFCICSKCGHKVSHGPGTPCRELRCPKCGGVMLREGSYHHELLKERKAGRTKKDQDS